MLQNIFQLNIWNINLSLDLNQIKKEINKIIKKDKGRVRCTATKKSGGRCKNTTKNSNKRCYAHQ